MKRCPCPCFPIIFSTAKKHESFPFPNIEGLKGKSETKLYPRCYDLKSCKQIIDSHPKSLNITVPSLGEMENYMAGYSDAPIRSPPKYRIGTCGKGPRIPSKGEDKPNPRRRRNTKKTKVMSYSLQPRATNCIPIPTSNKRSQEIGFICNNHSDEKGILSEEGISCVKAIVTPRNRNVYTYTNEFLNDIEVVLPSNLVNGTYANMSDDSNYVPKITNIGRSYTPANINDDLLCLSTRPTSKTVHVCNEDHDDCFDRLDSLDSCNMPRMMFHNEIFIQFLNKYIERRYPGIVNAYKQVYKELEQKYHKPMDLQTHEDNETDESINFASGPTNTNSVCSNGLSQEVDNVLHTQECQRHDLQHVSSQSQYEEEYNPIMFVPIIVTDYTSLTRRIKLCFDDNKYMDTVTMKELKAWFSVHHLRWHYNGTKNQIFESL